LKVLLTGACGFVGSALARRFREHHDAERLQILGIDNLSRPGSEQNRNRLGDIGVRFCHGDVRTPSDLEAFGELDWVVDAAANPSVLAGMDGRTSSRQLVEHNLLGTLNLLELCRTRRAGLILLSTSRVYSIAPLARLPWDVVDGAFVPTLQAVEVPGLGPAGIREEFPTVAPISLYGATKLASEALALEYHHAYDIPVWIDRCGVLAGAGQFGHPAQGIFSYWIHAHRARRPLRYIGFGGTGHQVRDCLHPADLADLVLLQMRGEGGADIPRVANVAGGARNSMSLAQLTAWCNERFGAHAVEPDPAARPFDVPWMVLDSALASQGWAWSPRIGIEAVLEEISAHAEQNPQWLDLSGGV
jgi:CDP-paratose 2-epimerase